VAATIAGEPSACRQVLAAFDHKAQGHFARAERHFAMDWRVLGPFDDFDFYWIGGQEYFAGTIHVSIISVAQPDLKADIFSWASRKCRGTTQRDEATSVPTLKPHAHRCGSTATRIDDANMNDM
jgi:hypothetical protein